MTAPPRPALLNQGQRSTTTTKPPVTPLAGGRVGDLRYQPNAEDPSTCRWPDLKARISTAGYDPGAA